MQTMYEKLGLHPAHSNREVVRRARAILHPDHRGPATRVWRHTFYRTLLRTHKRARLHDRATMALV